jgi:hypothetical protein
MVLGQQLTGPPLFSQDFECRNMRQHDDAEPIRELPDLDDSSLGVTQALEEYRIVADFYRYYTQLSFDIAKYFVIWNITLAGALILGKWEVKGAIVVLAALFGILLSLTAAVAFRKCIKHCAAFRNRAVELEKRIGARLFSRIKILNAKTRGTIFAARTHTLILVSTVCLIWLLFLLVAMGVPGIPAIPLR